MLGGIFTCNYVNFHHNLNIYPLRLSKHFVFEEVPTRLNKRIFILPKFLYDIYVGFSLAVVLISLIIHIFYVMASYWLGSEFHQTLQF